MAQIYPPFASCILYYLYIVKTVFKKKPICSFSFNFTWKFIGIGLCTLVFNNLIIDSMMFPKVWGKKIKSKQILDYQKKGRKFKKQSYNKWSKIQLRYFQRPSECEYHWNHMISNSVVPSIFVPGIYICSMI